MTLTHMSYWRWPGATAGKSSLVITALTPGMASASDVSMEMIRAWACGERTTMPWSWPGRLRSAAKRARPVTFSSPSWRTGRVPTYLYWGLGSVTVTCGS